VLVVDLGGGAAALRALIGRARHAAEHPLPVLLLLPDSSSWLRGVLPRDLLPAVTLPAREAAAAALARAFAQLSGDDLPSTRAEASRIAGGALPPLRFDPRGREVGGPDGAVRLTHSEAAIFGLLVRGDGDVVDHDGLAQELWSVDVADRHSRAAIRSHVHTLRGKLRSVGLAGAVASLPGVGYRLAGAAADGRGG
jgi:DNA-binding response OmpR family regulator